MNRLKNEIIETLQLALAILLASIGLKVFLLPNGFLDGGVTGIAILVSELLHIEISYILPVLSIPFLCWVGLQFQKEFFSSLSYLFCF